MYKRRVFIIDNSSYGTKSSKMWEDFANELETLDNVSRAVLIRGREVWNVDPEYAPFHDLSVISENLLNQLKRYFKPNSVFIFADARDPLVFMLRQQNQIYGYGHTFIGIWNDGTYDQFGVIRTWLRGQDYRWSDKLERALMDCYDYNLTPRESQVHHISKAISSLTAKTVKYCPLPFSSTLWKQMGLDYSYDKENLVVMNSSGNAKHNEELFKSLQHELPEFTFMSIHSMGLDVNSYYRILSRAKLLISTNSSDINAFSIVESMVAGCIPIVPDIQVYSEVIGEKYLYPHKVLRPPHLNFIREGQVVLEKIHNFLDNYDSIDMTDDIEQIINKHYSSEQLLNIVDGLTKN